jgi:hypothetical protein
MGASNWSHNVSIYAREIIEYWTKFSFESKIKFYKGLWACSQFHWILK